MKIQNSFVWRYHRKNRRVWISTGFSPDFSSSFSSFMVLCRATGRSIRSRRRSTDRSTFVPLTPVRSGLRILAAASDPTIVSIRRAAFFYSHWNLWYDGCFEWTFPFDGSGMNVIAIWMKMGTEIKSTHIFIVNMWKMFLWFYFQWCDHRIRIQNWNFRGILKIYPCCWLFWIEFLFSVKVIE